MKSLIIAVLAVSFIACNSNPETGEAHKNTDLIQQNLKGNVQTLAERNINFDVVFH